jgi:hypothetical protein
MLNNDYYYKKNYGFRHHWTIGMNMDSLILVGPVLKLLSQIIKYYIRHIFYTITCQGRKEGITSANLLP